MRANYKRGITMTIMSRTFQELSDEELRTLFTKIKKGGREDFTADRFISRIRSGEFGVFFNEHLFGSTQDELYAAYDEALGEERIRQCGSIWIPIPTPEPRAAAHFWMSLITGPMRTSRKSFLLWTAGHTASRFIPRITKIITTLRRPTARSAAGKWSLSV